MSKRIKRCRYCGKPRNGRPYHCGAQRCVAAYKIECSRRRRESTKAVEDNMSMVAKVRPIQCDKKWEEHLLNLQLYYKSQFEILKNAGVHPNVVSGGIADEILNKIDL